MVQHVCAHKKQVLNQVLGEEFHLWRFEVPQKPSTEINIIVHSQTLAKVFIHLNNSERPNYF